MASPEDKNLERAEQRFEIVLTLIDGWRRGATMEQAVNRFPGRADGAFDRKGDLLGNLDILTDQPEIGGPLQNRRRPVAAAPGKPDVVDVGHVARHANR